MISRASELSRELAQDICRDHPKYARAVNKVGPTVVGAAATALSGNPAVGTASRAGASVVSETAPNFFAEMVTTVGIGLAAQAGAFLLIPVVAVMGVRELFKKP